MPDSVKRVHYFDHQFLRASDFTDEQEYHVGTRRDHSRLLHTWGIAEGLEVEMIAGATAVTVTEGTAYDSSGREIVLAGNRSECSFLACKLAVASGRTRRRKVMITMQVLAIKPSLTATFPCDLSIAFEVRCRTNLRWLVSGGCTTRNKEQWNAQPLPPGEKKHIHK